MKLSVSLCLLTAVAALMLCLGTSIATPVRQRLDEGHSFAFTVDASSVVRPVNRRVMGASFFQLWDYLPIYDKDSGEWILRDSATQAIRSLRLPFSRLYWMDRNSSGEPSWDLHGSIDRVAEMCERFGIRQEDFVLELELQPATESMTPEEWANAVSYSLSKGYRFHMWEICNEPYNAGRGSISEAWTADAYIAHVKAVYAAVKGVQPDALVGISAGLGPFNELGATQTDDRLIRDLVGYYDFIAPHFYCHLKNLEQLPFERITLGGNAWVLNSYVTRTRELLDRYNPGRRVPILDTEWGMHGYNSTGRGADNANRNGNIAGALHRAIRMIYYLNEGLVDGAGQWCILAPSRSPGFSIVDYNDNRQFLNYYMNLYFGRFLGDQVVGISGTCPYYEVSDVPSDYDWNGQGTYDVSMPKVPVLATKSADGRKLYLIAANGTAAETLNCRVDLKGFRTASVEGKQLTQGDIDAPALVDNEADVMSALPVQLGEDGRSISFDCPAHALLFLCLTGAPA